jgi:hypothetical protein
MGVAVFAAVMSGCHKAPVTTAIPGIVEPVVEVVEARARSSRLAPGSFTVTVDLTYKGDDGPAPVMVTVVDPAGASHSTRVVLLGAKGAATYRAAFSPTSPLGPHRFRCAGGKGGTAEATVEVAADGLKPLTVTHVEPGHGRPGTEVVVRGSGSPA